MKYHPTNHRTQKREKIKYEVVIEDNVYTTHAYNEESAISNACFRYADDVDEDVALIKWKLKQGKLYFSVEEI